MLLAWPIHGIGVALENSRGYQAIKPNAPTPLWIYFVMAAPSVFDMVATALCMFGLVSVKVSIYQM